MRIFKTTSTWAMNITSNVTDRQRGPKRKLRAGYTTRHEIRCAMWRQSYFCLLVGAECKGSLFLASSVISRDFSALCAFDVRTSSPPHRLRLCQMSFLWRLPSLSKLMEKNRVLSQSIIQSLAQLIWCPGPGNRNFRFGRSSFGGISLHEKDYN